MKSSLGLLTLTVALCIAGSACREDLPTKTGQNTTPTTMPTAKPSTSRRVLLVHSYHPEYPWVAAVTRGVQKGLAGISADLEIFYMDTKRRTEEAWKIQAGELAGRKLDEYKPDLVITADDNAQQYFAKRYVGHTVPFVFCGVNSDPSKYGFPASNITGVIERPSLRAAVDYVHLICPFRRLAMLSSDDETSMAALGFMKQELVDAEVTEYNLVGGFDEWKKAVERYNKTVDALVIYVYHTVKEKGRPKSMEPKEVMHWTIEHATIPTLGLLEFGVEDGLLAGVVESGEEQGAKAAEHAVKILQGARAGSLPITKGEIGVRMINRSTAARLHISLPAEALKDAVVVPAESTSSPGR